MDWFDVAAHGEHLVDTLQQITLDAVCITSRLIPYFRFGSRSILRTLSKRQANIRLKGSNPFKGTMLSSLIWMALVRLFASFCDSNLSVGRPARSRTPLEPSAYTIDLCVHTSAVRMKEHSVMRFWSSCVLGLFRSGIAHRSYTRVDHIRPNEG